MSAANKHAFTLKAQLEILLFLKGDVYRSTTEVLRHAEGLGINVHRRTIQRWLSDLAQHDLVERKGGLFMRENKSPRSRDKTPMIDSSEWGWRWHRDTVLQRLDPMTTENRCNRLILRDLMAKHNLTRDKVAELAEVSRSTVDTWLHTQTPTPVHSAYIALIRSKLEKQA